MFIPFQMSDASLELPQEKKDFQNIRKTETDIDVVTRLLPNGSPVTTGSYDFLAGRLKFKQGAGTGA